MKNKLVLLIRYLIVLLFIFLVNSNENISNLSFPQHLQKIDHSNHNQRSLQYLGMNFIMNGDFTINQCGSTICTWLRSNFVGNYLPYWDFTTAIQIGLGNYYSNHFPMKYVLCLIVTNPVCIFQVIGQLPVGDYLLQYQYSMDTRASNPQDYRIVIQLNGIIIEQGLFYALNATDIHYKSIIITNTVDEMKQLIICSACSNNIVGLYGPIVNYVRLTYVGTNTNTNTNTNINNQIVNQNPLIQFLETVFKNSFIIQSVKIPGFQTIFSPLFSFFINLDRLWLYIYHQNNHSQNFNDFFHYIRNLQKIKFSNNYKKYVYQSLGISVDNSLNFEDYKLPYSSKNFQEIEGYFNTFIINFLDYFFINVIIKILLFFILKIINLCFHSRFKQFQFYGFLLFLLFDGYSESFTYFLASDYLNLFALRVGHKFINAFTLFFGFFLFSLMIGGYFITKFMYKKKANLFYQNCKSNFSSCVFNLMFFSLYNFGSGMIHSVGQYTPKTQFFGLLSLQIIIICSQVYFFRKSKSIFQHKMFVVWFLISSLVRILLIFIFIFKEFYLSNEQIFEKISLILLVIYISLSFLQILNTFLQTLIQKMLKMSIFLYKKQQKHSKSKHNSQKLYIGDKFTGYHNNEKKNVKYKLTKIKNNEILNNNCHFRTKKNLNINSNNKKATNKIITYKNIFLISNILYQKFKIKQTKDQKFLFHEQSLSVK